MTERKIWKELTDDERKAEVERLISSKLKISPGLLRDVLRQLQYQTDNHFSEVVIGGKLAPNVEIAKLNRYADYEEMDVDGSIGQALGPFADDATGVSE